MTLNRYQQVVQIQHRVLLILHRTRRRWVVYLQVVLPRDEVRQKMIKSRRISRCNNSFGGRFVCGKNEADTQRIRIYLND